MNATNEMIRLYAKQLKIPSFTEYQEVLRQADPSAGFADLLLELMKMETISRQENQNKRRLKTAGFPYTKTMEEFDCSQLNDTLTFIPTETCQLPVHTEQTECHYDWESRMGQAPSFRCSWIENLYPGI